METAAARPLTLPRDYAAPRFDPALFVPPPADSRSAKAVAAWTSLADASTRRARYGLSESLKATMPKREPDAELSRLT